MYHTYTPSTSASSSKCNSATISRVSSYANVLDPVKANGHDLPSLDKNLKNVFLRLSMKTITLTSLPLDSLAHVLDFLSAKDLAQFSTTCSSISRVAKSHPAWEMLVLQDFGFKYENFAMYTGLCDWRSLYSRAAGFVRNLKKSTPKKVLWPKLLEASEVPEYEGAMALSPDGRLLLWENGRVLEVVDLEEGKKVFKIDLSFAPVDASTRSIVTTINKAFIHMTGKIFVVDLRTGTFVQTLDLPASLGISDPALLSSDFGLDISIRNNQLTFLAKDALYVWNAHTLAFSYSIRHVEKDPADPFRTVSDGLDFLWAGYHLIPLSKFSGAPPASATDGRSRQREIRISQHVVTWLRGVGKTLKIFDASTGVYVKELEGHTRAIVRARQVVHPHDPACYFLASLDSGGEIRLWDSSSCVAVVNPGVMFPFRLCISPTHLITLCESRRSSQYVEVQMWSFNASAAARIDGPEICGPAGSRHRGGTEILTHVHSEAISAKATFCDILDNNILALWYQCSSSSDPVPFSRLRSDWEVYDVLGRDSAKKLSPSSAPLFLRPPPKEGSHPLLSEQTSVVDNVFTSQPPQGNLDPLLPIPCVFFCVHG